MTQKEGFSLCHAAAWPIEFSVSNYGYSKANFGYFHANFWVFHGHLWIFVMGQVKVSLEGSAIGYLMTKWSWKHWLYYGLMASRPIYFIWGRAIHHSFWYHVDRVQWLDTQRPLWLWWADNCKWVQIERNFFVITKLFVTWIHIHPNVKTVKIKVTQLPSFFLFEKRVPRKFSSCSDFK